MMARLQALRGQLLGSLWFVPGTIVLGAVVVALLMVELSAAVDAETLARWPRLFGAGADGSRSMLSGIATSMITVAGVTFSITMVAVTQASAQYTPRILRNFMRDRANQVVLGSFVGIFAYCIVVLRTIRGGEGTAFVPSLAVLGGVLLAIAGIAVLIFFVHHIATTLEASEIISGIAQDTLRAVDRLFPEDLVEAPIAARPAALFGTVPRDAWRPVPSPSTGYVQRTDISRLVHVARECGMLVRLERTTGDFVAAGRPLAWFAPHPSGPAAPRDDGRGADTVAGALAGQYVVSTYRILDHDPGFGIRQLVDIALRALSPGVNDSTTAVTCVDYLGAILQRVANRHIEVAHRDKEQVTRIMAQAPTFEELLEMTCDEIRQNARGNVSVLARQLAMLATVAQVTRSSIRRRDLGAQITLLHEAAARTVPSEHDRARLDALTEAGLAAVREGDEREGHAASRG